MPSEWSQLWEQAQRLFTYHVPTDSLPPLVPAALVLLAGGVVVAVLGARLARPALAGVFGLGGAIAAGRLSAEYGWSLAASVIIGGIVLAGAGFLLYRLWVAVAAGGILVALALGVVAYQRALPELQSYNQASLTANVTEEAGFAVLSPDEQARYIREDAGQWARGFWNHVTARHAGVQRNLAIIGGIAALLGITLGLIATRFTLILGTSLIGTALVGGAMAALAHNFTPNAYREALSNPPWLYGGIAAFLLCSLVFQARLNRKPRLIAPDTSPA
jgi:hypothetical protein